MNWIDHVLHMHISLYTCKKNIFVYVRTTPFSQLGNMAAKALERWLFTLRSSVTTSSCLTLNPSVLMHIFFKEP